MAHPFPPPDVESVLDGLAAHDYLPDRGLATAIFLALEMQRPLFLEGEPGVGKTEVARVLAAWSGEPLIRLQCYDGIDTSQAVYEWDHARQLLHLRAAEAGEPRAVEAIEDELYHRRFLIERPLLAALRADGGPSEGAGRPVLLIDEIDRADDEFEAYLLEVLADFSITIPELGTIRAAVPPIVVLTSNRTRDVHDALKRRCLYHWIEHPSFDREVQIVRLRVPGVSEVLARQLARLVEAFRNLGLYKPPGVAETIDWASAVASLGRTTVDEELVSDTLGAVLKYREDQQRVRMAGLADAVGAAIDNAQ